jgi:hypothetical protein
MKDYSYNSRIVLMILSEQPFSFSFFEHAFYIKSPPISNLDVYPIMYVGFFGSERVFLERRNPQWAMNRCPDRCKQRRLSDCSPHQVVMPNGCAIGFAWEAQQ